MNKKLVNALLISASLVISSMGTPIFAEDIDTQITNAAQNVSNIEQQIETVQAQLQETQNKFKEVQQRAMDTLSKQTQALEQAQKLNEEIASLKEIISKREHQVAEQLRAVQTTGTKSYIDFILDSESISDLLNRVQVIATVINANQETIDTLEKSKRDLEEKEAEQQAIIAEQQQIAFQLEVLKEELDQTVTAYQASLETLTQEQQQAVLQHSNLLEEKTQLEEQAAQAAAQANRIAQEQAMQAQVASAPSALASVENSVVAQTVTEVVNQQVPGSTTTENESKSVVEVGNEETTSTVSTPAATNSSAVSIAQQYLGVPYVWGGASPSGFDCSGLVQYVYAQLGVSLPRVTYSQEKAGTRISLSEAQPGDLLFWGTPGSSYHVAIYMGNQTFIHAPTQGGVVEIRTFSYYMPSYAVRL